MKRVIHLIVFVLNIVAAVLLIASTMAGMVRPSKFIYFSLLSYGCLTLIFVNVLFALYWLVKSNVKFLLSTAAIVLRVGFVPIFFQAGGCSDIEGSAREGQNTLVMMSFNTHGFRGTEAEVDQNDMADGLAAQFLTLTDSLRPDVLNMQEFRPVTQNMNLCDSLRQRGYIYHADLHDSQQPWGVVVYSKLPIANKQNYDRGSKFYVDITKSGKELRLFPMHMGSYKLDPADKEALEQLSQGGNMAEKARPTLGKFKHAIIAHETEWDELKPMIEQSGKPVVVAGDFNDTPASYLYQHMKKLLRDTYMEQGKGFGTTYHGFFPAYRIDYVLHTDGIESLAYRRVRNNISDHYPVVVTLELNPEEGGRQ